VVIPSTLFAANAPCSSSSLVFSVPSPSHELVRKQATENYLTTANKKQKYYDEHLRNLADKFNQGDCVGIKIHDVDRTNTDPKILPGVIHMKEKKSEDFVFELTCQFGILTTKFDVESLVDLKTACQSN
ncbi:unnamed protein product, partial [Didymodactylos carnosus]